MKSVMFFLLRSSADKMSLPIFRAGIILIPSFQLCRGAERISTSRTSISGLEALISRKYFPAKRQRGQSFDLYRVTSIIDLHFFTTKDPAIFIVPGHKNKIIINNHLFQFSQPFFRICYAILSTRQVFLLGKEE
jgi:hypothetical protein